MLDLKVVEEEKGDEDKEENDDGKNSNNKVNNINKLETMSEEDCEKLLEETAAVKQTILKVSCIWTSHVSLSLTITI